MEARNPALSAFPRRLKEAIGGHPVAELANKTGMSEAAIRKYLRAAAYPGLESLLALASATQVEVGWLASGEGEMRHGALVSVADSSSLASGDDLATLRRERDRLQRELDASRRYEGSPTVRVPVFDVPLEAGRINPTARATEIDALVSYETAYREWLRTECGVDPDRAFMAPVNGQSMEDLLFDGDWILGEQQDHVDRDGIFAVVLNGSMLIKYVQRGRKRGTLDLISRNPAFPAYTASVDAGDSFYVIGRYARRITR